jgi:hypothetical protein
LERPHVTFDLHEVPPALRSDAVGKVIWEEPDEEDGLLQAPDWEGDSFTFC